MLIYWQFKLVSQKRCFLMLNLQDIDIRKQLHIDLEKAFADDPTTKIIDGLGLCSGEVRIELR